MSDTAVEQLARTVLYEGYVLYPYRASNVKNRYRWTFGTLVPRSLGEHSGNGGAWCMRADCLLLGGKQTVVTVRARFLQIVERTVGALPAPIDRLEWETRSSRGELPEYQVVDEMEVAGTVYQTWQYGVQRKVATQVRVAPSESSSRQRPFHWAASRSVRPLCDAHNVVGILLDDQRAVSGALDSRAEPVKGNWPGGEKLLRLTTQIENLTRLDGAEHARRGGPPLASLASTHAVVSVTGGEFLSRIDPPDEYRDAAAMCVSRGAWPVLVGTSPDRSTMLLAPIILEDYPQIAGASPGDFCDATEIDEMLALRVQTLTDDEKRRLRALDDLSQQILGRCEALRSSDLDRLHATLHRTDESDRTDGPECCSGARGELTTRNASGQTTWRPGDRVRLRPRGRADAFDLVLRGKRATVERIERDLEGGVHVAVTVDDDPGRDFGAAGMPGHRFFFHPEELEPTNRSEDP